VDDSTVHSDEDSAGSTELDLILHQVVMSMLIEHLAEQRAAGAEVAEELLAYWYLTQLEDEISNGAQLVDLQRLVQKTINLMIKDRVIVEHCPSHDPMRPELRVLMMHPSFSVGSFRP